VRGKWEIGKVTEWVGLFTNLRPGHEDEATLVETQSNAHVFGEKFKQWSSCHFWEPKVLLILIPKADFNADDEANAKAAAWPQLNRQFCTQIHLI